MPSVHLPCFSNRTPLGKQEKGPSVGRDGKQLSPAEEDNEVICHANDRLGIQEVRAGQEEGEGGEDEEPETCWDRQGKAR